MTQQETLGVTEVLGTMFLATLFGMAAIRRQQIAKKAKELAERPLRVMIFIKRDIQAIVGLNHVIPQLHERGYHITLMVNAHTPKKCSSPLLQEMQTYECEAMIKRILPCLDNSEYDVDEVRQAVASGKLASLRMLCDAYNIDMHYVKKTHSPENLDLVESLEPDVMINLRNTVIYKPPLINKARICMFNIHSGRVPNYKGLMAPWRSIRAGDESLHPTLHLIEDAGIDTGLPIFEGSFPVDRSKTFLYHSCYLYKPCLTKFVQVLDRIKAGENVRDTAVRRGAATADNYYPTPTEQELEDGIAAGLDLFSPAEFIHILKDLYVPDSLPHHQNEVQSVIAELRLLQEGMILSTPEQKLNPPSAMMNGAPALDQDDVTAKAKMAFASAASPMFADGQWFMPATAAGKPPVCF